MKLDEIQISDGRILSISSDVKEVVITFQDWKEQVWKFYFYDVLAIQSFSVEGEELSHLTVIDRDDFKDIALEHFSDENPEDFHCYSFFGVWSDKILLRIIARRNYKIDKIIDS